MVKIFSFRQIFEEHFIQEDYYERSNEKNYQNIHLKLKIIGLNKALIQSKQQQQQKIENSKLNQTRGIHVSHWHVIGTYVCIV